MNGEGFIGVGCSQSLAVSVGLLAWIHPISQDDTFFMYECHVTCTKSYISCCNPIFFSCKMHLVHQARQVILAQQQETDDSVHVMVFTHEACTIRAFSCTGRIEWCSVEL